MIKYTRQYKKIKHSSSPFKVSWMLVLNLGFKLVYHIIKIRVHISLNCHRA